MAVVSISRIQVRRGQKNIGSGLPQLASGEFGWAIDTQELFIGNGAVSEGAPYVGNTKLLSENDNLFEFANKYEYKSGTNIQTGDSPNNPVLRSLQERLDDRVSIRSFGAPGDGTDQTEALQRAVDQLYLNASNKGQSQARVELILEPGEYVISNTIFLPPFTTLRGAGADKTKIIGNERIAFKTCNETSVPGTYAEDATSTTLNQARNIKISDLSIITAGGAALDLISCRDSEFTNLHLESYYQFGFAEDSNVIGIRLSSLSTAVSSNNNKFENITISKFDTGVASDNDIKNNIWFNCTFDTCRQGISFGINTILGTSGMLTGPLNNIISHSTFDNIFKHGIEIVSGTDNKSQNNKFYNVGNTGGSDLLAAHAIIVFSDIRNTSDSDWFKRSEELGYNETYKNGVVYHPEVQGPTIADFGTTHKLTIGQSSTPTKLFRLPADEAKAYEIEYIYKSNFVEATRTGVMTLVVDPVNDKFTLSDDYEFVGNGTWSEKLKFTAQNYDEDGNSSVDTVAIMMLNLTLSDDATLNYKVKTKS